MTSPAPDWPVSWQEARDAVLDSALAATPTQRLQWLEAALNLAYGAGKVPEDGPGKSGAQREGRKP